MGMFDTFSSADKKLHIQLKNGACVMNEFTEGDHIDDPFFMDGIYVGLEGYVVIRDSKVEIVTDSMHDLAPYKNLSVFSKWGDEISLEDDIKELNPIVQVINKEK